jgi:hypothetical protein
MSLVLWVQTKNDTCPSSTQSLFITDFLRVLYGDFTGRERLRTEKTDVLFGGAACYASYWFSQVKTPLGVSGSQR